MTQKREITWWRREGNPYSTEWLASGQETKWNKQHFCLQGIEVHGIEIIMSNPNQQRKHETLFPELSSTVSSGWVASAWRLQPQWWNRTRWGCHWKEGLNVWTWVVGLRAASWPHGQQTVGEQTEGSLTEGWTWLLWSETRFRLSYAGLDAHFGAMFSL